MFIVGTRLVALDTFYLTSRFNVCVFTQTRTQKPQALKPQESSDIQVNVYCGWKPMIAFMIAFNGIFSKPTVWSNPVVHAWEGMTCWCEETGDVTQTCDIRMDFNPYRKCSRGQEILYTMTNSDGEVNGSLWLYISCISRLPSNVFTGFPECWSMSTNSVMASCHRTAIIRVQRMEGCWKYSRGSSGSTTVTAVNAATALKPLKLRVLSTILDKSLDGCDSMSVTVHWEPKLSTFLLHLQTFGLVLTRERDSAIFLFVSMMYHQTQACVGQAKKGLFD